MNWQSLWQNLPLLLHATWVSIQLLICALTVGLSMAIIFSLTLEHHKNIFTAIIKSYIFVFRGTPMLVQFFIVYYGAGQFEFITHSFLWIAFKQPFFCAAFTLALNTAAYTTELFRGAIRAIPHGEIEAAQAFGMSKFLIATRVILPNMWQIILPAYSNEVIMVLKGTSLASAITVAELTNVTQSIIGSTYETLQFLGVAAVIYLLLNMLIVGLFKIIDKNIFYSKTS